MGYYERRTFRVFWGLWTCALAAGVILGSLTYDRVLWIVFGLAEAWAVWRRTADDTLSEFAEWVRTAFEPEPAGNWVAAAIIVLSAYSVGRVASFGYHPVTSMQTWHPWGVTLASGGPDLLLGLLVGVLVVGILSWHWLARR